MFKREVFIAICYHKIAPLIKTDFLVPIHVGRSRSTTDIAGTIGDDSGQNISEKNPSWCELTGLYWMRHNVDSKYYGLMHYRRVFNFAKSGREGHKFTDIRDRHFNKFGWNNKDILAQLEDCDIITAPTWDTHPVGAPHLHMSNYDMYAREHFSKDLDIVEVIIKNKYPEYYPWYVQYVTGKCSFFANMSIMSRSFFFEYVDWLFDILSEAEMQIDIANYDAYQRRIWGFLAERLTNVYVRHAKAIHGARVKELPTIFGVHPKPLPSVGAKKDPIIEDAARVDLLSHSTEPVNVVMATDHNYAPHAGAAILSAVKTSKMPRRLNFIILENGKLTNEDRLRLRSITERYGASLTFSIVDTKALSWLPLNRKHISEVTYYRLLMHQTLPANINKVIYIDSDTIVLEPIEELWDYPLDGNPVGGCPDEGGALQTRRLRLPLSHTYFNAGVMIFDLEAIRKAAFLDKVLDVYRKNADFITLQDQDILNLVFCEKTKTLPLRWNVNSRLFTRNELEPSYSQDSAREAVSAPAIIHFTDRLKPWHSGSANPYTKAYWYFRNEGPWSENTRDHLKRVTAAYLRDRLSARRRRMRA